MLFVLSSSDSVSDHFRFTLLQAGKNSYEKHYNKSLETKSEKVGL